MKMNESSSETNLLDFEPSQQTFLNDVLTGLQSEPRYLPCKYFYDEYGSQLFEKICELDEYYLTRTELSIMNDFSPEMAEQIGPGAMLVEYGSGSSVKTRVLLDQLDDLAAYVPVDISRDHLAKTAKRLSKAYPKVEIRPVCADFTEPFELPPCGEPTARCVVYFPGSTIGNFQTATAREMLARISTLCGTGGGLLIGIDLEKETTKLEAAYNDSEGVTAEFNLNLLRRVNRELDADFDLDQFQHCARYGQEEGRIEIHLISQCEQTVTVAGESFKFERGEPVRTEYSHKYTIEGFSRLAAEAGLSLKRHWTDSNKMFGILYFAVLD